MMITVSGEFGQVPKDVVQTKVLTPLLNPVTVELLIVLVVMAPVPVITVHTPNPIAGEFPLSVAVFVQMVWSGPALAGVGNGFT
jgi:hypothetical protein